jgi:RNA 2',3'-cyclic 3'-phosphodiesterase
MRLFVALSIPSEVRENIASLMRTLRRADAKPRWVNPENLHVTLKFIGEVAEESVPSICGALQTIRPVEPLTLAFRGVGFFPNARRPNVAWIGIEAPPGLSNLAAAVNRALAPFGIAPETKPFVPHLTVARFKEARLLPALQGEIEKCKDHSFGHFTTAEIHLIESRLRSSGAEYTTLRSFHFAQTESES